VRAPPRTGRQLISTCALSSGALQVGVGWSLLASNPNPVEREAYDRQTQAYLHFDALERLGGIKAPTLGIVGEQDLPTPPWVAHGVAGGIPGARFEIVTGDGSSHVVPLARPDDFNQLGDELPGRVIA